MLVMLVGSKTGKHSEACGALQRAVCSAPWRSIQHGAVCNKVGAPAYTSTHQSLR